MKRFILLLLVVLMTPSSVWAFRCGTHLVEEGDHTYEVVDKCGEPKIKEHLGYTLKKFKIREFVIERWVYGPFHGYHYVLTFEGGVLKSIEGRRGH